MTNLLTKTQTSLASGTTDIAVMTYWANLLKVRVQRQTLRQIFTDAGLGDAVPRDPHPDVTLHTAAGCVKPSKKRPVRIELKSKSDTLTTYAVQISHRPDDRTGWLEQATITLDRTVPEPIPQVAVDHRAPVVNQIRDAAIAEVCAEYADLRKHAKGEEVSSMLVTATKLVNAIVCRSGLYLVPTTYAQPLYLLRDALARETPVRMTLWEIRDTPANVAEAKEDARASLIDELRDLRHQVEEFIAGLAGATTVGGFGFTKSLNYHVRCFKELDGKVALYTDLLQDTATHLHVQIAAARKQLLGAYLGEDAADEKAVG